MHVLLSIVSIILVMVCRHINVGVLMAELFQKLCTVRCTGTNYLYNELSS